MGVDARDKSPSSFELPLRWLCAAGTAAELSQHLVSKALFESCLQGHCGALTHTACVGSTQEPQARQLNKAASDGMCIPDAVSMEVTGSCHISHAEQ